MTARAGFSVPLIKENDVPSIRRALDEITDNLNGLLVDSTDASVITRIVQSAGGSGGVEMRGNAVFVSATEPTNPELNDIWIKI